MSARQNQTALHRRRRAESRDARAPKQGRAKTRRIDLGLALLARRAQPGVCYTRQEIAVFCGCSDAAIYAIERKALGKLRALGKEQLR